MKEKQQLLQLLAEVYHQWEKYFYETEICKI